MRRVERGRASRRRGVLAFAFVLGLTTPRVAQADEPNATQIEAARRLYQQALEDEKRGDYRQAIEKLQRAGTVKVTAASRYHLGLCEEKLGHLVAALAHYQAAEQQAQAEGKKEVAELVREPLGRLTEKVPRLTLRVARPEPPGFELLLDGKPLAQGLYGLEVRVDVGPHPIEARAPGYTSFVVTHDAREGGNTSIDVRLDKQPVVGAPTSPAAAPQTGTGSVAAPAAGATKADRQTEPTSRRGPSGASIAAFGGAAVLTGFGIISFVRAGALRDQGRDVCALRTSECTDLRGPVRTWDALALGSWVGAGAAVLTGVILFTPSGGSAARPVVSLGPSEISIGGAF